MYSDLTGTLGSANFAAVSNSRQTSVTVQTGQSLGAAPVTVQLSTGRTLINAAAYLNSQKRYAIRGANLDANNVLTIEVANATPSEYVTVATVYPGEPWGPLPAAANSAWYGTFANANGLMELKVLPLGVPGT
jgi:hypothetical protein